MKSLLELYTQHQGKVSVKWQAYFDVYDRTFAYYQNIPVSLFEIGVQNGGSLEIWGKYFQHAENIIGCDINPDCAKLSYDDPRIQLIIGDANKDDVHAKILRHSPKFDIVIDDGSHFSGDVIRTFCRYFGAIKDGGLFIAEDLHCSYWQEYGGGLYSPFSSMAFFKRLADIVNIEHVGVAKQRRELLHGILQRYGANLDELDLGAVHSIEFVNSICVVRKRLVEANVLGKRVVAGKEERIVAGHFEISSKFSEPLSQSTNMWSVIDMPPDEAYEEIHRKLSEQKDQLASLTQSLAEKETQIVALHNSFSWRLTHPLRRLYSWVCGRKSGETVPSRGSP